MSTKTLGRIRAGAEIFAALAAIGALAWGYQLVGAPAKLADHETRIKAVEVSAAESKSDMRVVEKTLELIREDIERHHKHE